MKSRTRKNRGMKEKSGGGGSSGESSRLIGRMLTPAYDHQLHLHHHHQSSPPPVQAPPLPHAGGSIMEAVTSTQPILPHDASYPDQAQFEADKRSVYKHPLFPLLALLFEKCEMATQTTSESPISDSFHQDLEAFVQHQERDKKPFLINDPEIDGLMIKAIQVLRIHLLELDKVQELCKDFCNRYITCLKGKMQSENLLRSDYYDNNGIGNNLISSQSNSPHHSYSSNGETSISPPNGAVFHVQDLNHGQLHPNYHHHNLHQHHHPNSNPSPSSLSHSNNTLSSSSAGSVGQSLGPHQGSPDDLRSNSNNSHPHSHYHQTPISTTGNSSNCGGGVSHIHGGTPLSQIGANLCPPAASQQDLFVQTPQSPSSGEDEEDYLGRKKPKRGVLPKHATSIMRSWLFQHIVHPYPTEDEKRQIAAQTNLTLLQVNNWFINARRRILQPMLDASNPEASTTQKVKKVKTHSSKPALKYWSDNLASASSGHLEDVDESNGLGQDLDESSDDDLDGDGSSNDGNDLLIDNSDSSQP